MPRSVKNLLGTTVVHKIDKVFDPTTVPSKVHSGAMATENNEIKVALLDVHLVSSFKK
jgi:hypothetical protein